MDGILGISLQYRVKPMKDWITIKLSGVIIKPNPDTIIDISGFPSGMVFESRVAQITMGGMSEYSDITETTAK